MIQGLKEDYPKYIIGYSDHTLPCENMLTLTSAFLLGAVIIEKHFTHNKALEGNDHYHAMDSDDLKNFINLVNSIQNLKGSIFSKNFLPSEEISRINARRSIVASQDIKKGDFLNESNITCKRPGTGINPSNWDKVIGMKLKKNIMNDHILNWEIWKSNNF